MDSDIVPHRKGVGNYPPLLHAIKDPPMTFLEHVMKPYTEVSRESPRGHNATTNVDPGCTWRG